VSNKQNPRRARQRVRSEIRRKPVIVTAAMSAMFAAIPAERERKERERRHARDRQRGIDRIRRRWALQGPRAKRKPRTNYGNTFWKHSHDV